MDNGKKKRIIRDMEKKTLPLYIASIALSNGEVYGYDVMKSLRKSHGGTGLSPSEVYPRLIEMEKEGLLSSDIVLVKGRGRRLYKPTEKTREMVVTYKSALNMNIIALNNVIPEDVTIGAIPLQTVSTKNRK